MSRKEKLEELDPLNIKLNDNLSRLAELSQFETSPINNNADYFKIEFLIRISNSLDYMTRAFLGIEKNLARIADSLEILSAGK